MKRPEWWMVAISLYCMWNARDLAAAWRDAPYERGAWVCLVIWLSPIIAAFLTGRATTPKTGFLIGALALAAAGAVTSVNFLSDVAIALAAVAWSPQHGRLAVWAAASILWMPVSGWLAHGLDPLPLLAARITLTAIASAWYAAAVVRPHVAGRSVS